MNEVEYYSKAQRDASFRQQQLEEMGYQKNMAKAFFGLGVVAMAIFAGYCGFVQHRMVDLSGLGMFSILLSWKYTYARTKLTALQAIDHAGKDTQPITQ